MHFPYCNKYEYPFPTEAKKWWVEGWPCPIEAKNWWVGGWVQHAKEYGYQLDWQSTASNHRMTTDLV